MSGCCSEFSFSGLSLREAAFSAWIWQLQHVKMCLNFGFGMIWSSWCSLKTWCFDHLVALYWDWCDLWSFRWVERQQKHVKHPWSPDILFFCFHLCSCKLWNLKFKVPLPGTFPSTTCWKRWTRISILLILNFSFFQKSSDLEAPGIQTPYLFLVYCSFPLSSL